MAMVDVTSDLRLPPKPWFKDIKRIGVFEVAHTNLTQNNARWWYKWEGQKVEPLPMLQSSLNVGDVATMSVLKCLRIGDQKDSEAANRSPRQHCIKWLSNWVSERTDIPHPILQKREQEDVRVRAARPSSELRAAVTATKGEIKPKTLERAPLEMQEAGILYNWQVGGRWWLVLSDAGSAVVGNRSGVISGGGNEKRDPEDRESRLGDQGKSVR